MIKNKPIEAKSVERYLESKFGESLDPVRAAMRDLVKYLRPEQLSKNAFSLHEEFQPAIPEAVKGWGAKGSLDQLESELSGFLFDVPDLSGRLLNFVELCSPVDVFDFVTEHAIDQTGYTSSAFDRQANPLEE